MSIVMQFTICNKCGHVYKFYPEGMKVFCPKCMAMGPGDEIGIDPVALKIKSLVIKSKSKKNKNKEL
ncbi:MAG: hypothetical protein K5655_03450 [Lachnospiraceae bacterium]|jgi:hypothetical protein|nr:hypothetical protein [Lachnospiraceae bacterium]